VCILTRRARRAVLAATTSAQRVRPGSIRDPAWLIA
jgi:hypothetical protein